MLGLILTLGTLSYCSESGALDDEIPEPPYINKNGNVDWDKKLENELNK